MIKIEPSHRTRRDSRRYFETAIRFIVSVHTRVLNMPFVIFDVSEAISPPPWRCFGFLKKGNGNFLSASLGEMEVYQKEIIGGAVTPYGTFVK
ncbi:hypothetical protein L6Q79_03945 [bacterium]|nr:hypothetical protein [bacterium]NUN44309.1 hypothetical protein [bacterium]